VVEGWLAEELGDGLAELLGSVVVALALELG